MPNRIPRTEPKGRGPRSSFADENPLQHVRALYAVFVQGLFYSRQRGNMHWEPDMQDTEITITAEGALHTTTVGDRPGIAFTRAPVRFSQLGFDDLLKYDATSGKKIKSLLIPGTMVINCCSKNDLESEKVAWIVAENIWLQRDVLMQQGFYDVGRNIEVNAPSKAGSIVEGDGAEEWFATSVISPFFFHRTSSFTPLGKRVLNGIDLSLHTVHPPVIAQGVPIVGANGTIDPPFQQDVFPPPPFAPGAGNPNIRTRDNPHGLPVVPHPLNPARTVVIHSSRADRPGLRPPSIYGRVLPIASVAMEESETAPVGTTVVKV